MKPETLNGLVIDRAFGELAPDVVELLDSYLKCNPSAATEAAALTETARLARVATASNVPPAEAPPRRPPWRARVVSMHWLQLAATLVLGAGVGWLARHPGPAVPVSGAVIAQLASTSEARPAPPNSFWSTTGAASEEARDGVSDRSTKYRLRWSSPGKMPRWEGAR